METNKMKSLMSPSQRIHSPIYVSGGKKQLIQTYHQHGVG